MTRRALPRLLAGLVAAAAVAVPGLGEPARADTRTPLQVSIETLGPATIPERGPVTISGTVTNRSTETWTGLNAYLLTSPAPLRSRAELARASASDADSQVGVRRTAEGLYAEVGDLAPGESRGYRLRVNRANLGIDGQPGVYWLGVHVLGAQEGQRDSIADGRARTFMPLLPTPGTPAAGRARTRLALVVPIRQPVRRGGAGRLLGLPTWNRALGADGRLDRLLRLSARASQPITWVVDPAVLDAVQSVARGNPRLDTGPPGDDTTSPSGSPSPAPSPDDTPADPGGSPADPSGSPAADPAADLSGSSSGSPSGSPSDAQPPTATPGTEGATPQSSSAAAARAWLDELRRQAPAHTVATVPYGDLDVAATLSDDQLTLYQRATTLSAATAAGYGIENPVPVVDPVSGYLPESALRQIGGDTTVLLDQAAVPGTRGPVLPGSSVAPAARAPVVVTDGRAGSGGPKPNSQYAALQFRQRLLSDAALHAISGRRTEPLVVTTPTDWNPGDAWALSRFFGGLAQPWLQMVDLRSVAASTSLGVGPGGEAQQPTLTYPASESVAQVPVDNLAVTEQLLRTAGVFAELIGDDGTVASDLSKQALLGASVNARADTALSRSQTTEAIGYVRSLLAAVHIEGPPFVMMSGESGPIQVTLVNDLDRTVTVGLAMSTPGSRLRIDPVPPVTLGPGRRTSIRLQASSDDIGVHAVTLRVVDAGGRALGSQTRFSVRTSNVSTVIWVIIGVGGALLLLAIVVRLYRRVRRSRSTPGSLPPQGRGPLDRPGDRAQQAGREPV